MGVGEDGILKSVISRAAGGVAVKVLDSHMADRGSSLRPGGL